MPRLFTAIYRSTRVLVLILGLSLGVALIGSLVLAQRPTIADNARLAQVPPTIVAPGVVVTGFPVTAAPLGNSAQIALPCVNPPPPYPPRPYPQPQSNGLPPSDQDGMVPVYPCLTPPFLPVSGDPVIVQNYQLQTTILDQVAVTHLTLTLANQGAVLAQGANVIPLPAGATVSDLTLAIDGVPVQGQIMDVDQARGIYTQTVRALRDPALLQYIGDRALQVQIFPIAPGSSRTVTLQYTQLLSGDNGQIAYRAPLPINTYSRAPIRHLSIAVALSSTTPLGTLYAPDSAVVISQADTTHAQAGYERDNVLPNADFQLYYTLAGSGNNQLPTSLLTYRPDPAQDGYFMLLFAPPITARAQAVSKDVILILDQSGSMIGQKWTQAQAAAVFVLNHLNPGDRFGALTFSTGFRLYNRALLPAAQVGDAVSWVQNQQAGGGTDIDSALQQGLALADPTRQTTILFMTDGQPTEGQTDLDTILRDTQAKAGSNVRFFNFGVGDDVNTYLLDSLAANQHGTTVYVHPTEDLEAAISVLYNKISAPVLTGLSLDTGSLTISDQYPTAPLPDLYAGQQLIVAGRYHGSGSIALTINGQQGSTTQQFTLPPFTFPAQDTKQPFVASLWATRKIGYLLQQIRLHGNNPELIAEVKQLSVQYGILTPYTAYLVQENLKTVGGVAGQSTATPIAGLPPGFGVPQAQNSQGSAGSAQSNSLQPLAAPAQAQTGRDAVNSAQLLGNLAGANNAANGTNNAANGAAPTQTVDGKSFVLQNGVWIDTAYLLAQTAKTTLTAESIAFGSDAYFAFLTAHPELAHALALGTKLIIVVGDTAVTITD